MTTRRPKARKTAKKAVRRPATKRRPTKANAAKRPSPLFPFGKMTARDWAHVRETGVQNSALLDQETIMTSIGYIDVGRNRDGAYVSAYGRWLPESMWPRPVKKRATKTNGKRAANLRPAKRPKTTRRATKRR